MAGKVGFIGLGNMGGPMALNLVKAVFTLVVHDIGARKVERLIARGAAKAESADAVAAATDRTVCIVETTARAQDVIAGERGGVAMLDASVSGGTERGDRRAVDHRGRCGGDVRRV